MNYQNKEAADRFFQGLALRLHEAEIQTGQATAYHLPILCDGYQVRKANASGMVTRRSTYLKSREATAVNHQTVHAVFQIQEQMTAMKTTPPPSSDKPPHQGKQFRILDIPA